MHMHEQGKQVVASLIYHMLAILNQSLLIKASIFLSLREASKCFREASMLGAWTSEPPGV
jgi:hypothetical protein